MDDIRRPQHLKRRDYSTPARPAATHPRLHPLAQNSPPHHNPPHHPPTSYPPSPNEHRQPHTAQVYPGQPAQAAPHTHSAPAQLQPLSTPQAQSQPAATRHKRFKLSGKVIWAIIGVIVAGAAIFGAGYLLKGASDSNGIPASITRQVNYNLYFPSPMPAGYTYMKNTATFQIGQVYYKFANGNKRVTVVEQPMSDPQPDLKKLAGYTLFQSAVGPAAFGMDVGEPSAVVLTPTTIITMHTIGGASTDDLKVAINNLKNIGQKPTQ